MEDKFAETSDEALEWFIKLTPEEKIQVISRMKMEIIADNKRTPDRLILSEDSAGNIKMVGYEKGEEK
jgi:hypothetical protein